MGAARQAAERITSALEARDYQQARQSLAGNFRFSPLHGEPMSADEWIDANKALHHAFDDFSYNFEIIREDGNEVWVQAHMAGTHTGDWDITRMGGGVIPATGKYVSAGASLSRGIVNSDGKIEVIEITEEGQDGGIGGLLQQLGVQMG